MTDSQMEKDFPIYYVIMAGGRGTRFWPRSRTRKPKQLLDIIGPQTMLEQTIDRILPLSDWDHIVVVTEISRPRPYENYSLD